MVIGQVHQMTTELVTAAGKKQTICNSLLSMQAKPNLMFFQQ
jgi:hypothetical protein